MAFNPGDILPVQYDMTYVLASYAVSVMGSLMALYHAGHTRRRDGSIDRDMLAGAAFSRHDTPPRLHNSLERLPRRIISFGAHHPECLTER